MINAALLNLVISSGYTKREQKENRNTLFYAFDTFPSPRGIPRLRAGSLPGAFPAFYFRVKFLIFIGTNVGAAVGWAAGERFGLMTAFIVSGVGSAFGVYAGWWAARRWL